MSYNYPNHPLFRITPILDRDFHRVDYDNYTNVLVAKIRDGRYTTDLFDCNTLYLPYEQRMGHHPYIPAFSVKSRYKMTPEERQAYLAEVEELHRTDREARAKRAAELKAARAQVKAEAEALRQARERELERRAQEWAAEQTRRDCEREAELLKRAEAQGAAKDYVRQARAILAGRWECNTCWKASAISPHSSGYLIRCPQCGKQAFGKHETLWEIVSSGSEPPKDPQPPGPAEAALLLPQIHDQPVKPG